jgi:hypothetical protein
MTTKNKGSTSTPSNDLPEQQGIKHILSKYEYDLYKEEDDIALKVIRVKKFSMPNKGAKWKIMIDNKVTFVIEGTKISKKEREFLETVNGFNFILAQAKIGIKSLNGFKNDLRQIMPSTEPVVVQKQKRSKK